MNVILLNHNVQNFLSAESQTWSTVFLQVLVQSLGVDDIGMVLQDSLPNVESRLARLTSQTPY